MQSEPRLAPVFTKILNRLLDQGIVPSSYIPVPTQDLIDYRPYVLMSVAGSAFALGKDRQRPRAPVSQGLIIYTHILKTVLFVPIVIIFSNFNATPPHLVIVII